MTTRKKDHSLIQNLWSFRVNFLRPIGNLHNFVLQLNTKGRRHHRSTIVLISKGYIRKDISYIYEFTYIHDIGEYMFIFFYRSEEHGHVMM